MASPVNFSPVDSSPASPSVASSSSSGSPVGWNAEVEFIETSKVLHSTIITDDVFAESMTEGNWPEDWKKPEQFEELATRWKDKDPYSAFMIYSANQEGENALGYAIINPSKSPGEVNLAVNFLVKRLPLDFKSKIFQALLTYFPAVVDQGYKQSDVDVFVTCQKTEKALAATLEALGAEPTKSGSLRGHVISAQKIRAQRD